MLTSGNAPVFKPAPPGPGPAGSFGPGLGLFVPVTGDGTGRQAPTSGRRRGGLRPCYPLGPAARLADGDTEVVAMAETVYGIVAGYDGSPGAAQALRWAVREAGARGTILTVCLAWTPDHMELAAESTLWDLARQHGQEVLARGLPDAESVLGPGRVRPDLAAGSAAYVLCERSRAA